MKQHAVASEQLMLVKKNGQVVEENVMVLGTQPKYVDRGKEYAKVFVTFLSDLITDEKLNKASKLLFYIIENLNFNDLTIILIPSHAVADLGISEKTFYNYLNILLEKKILIKTERKQKYRLQDYIAIKGSMRKTIKIEKEKENEEKKQDKASKVVEKAKMLKGRKI